MTALHHWTVLNFVKNNVWAARERISSVVVQRPKNEEHELFFVNSQLSSTKGTITKNHHINNDGKSVLLG
jgi:hypothetical protein